MNGLYHLMQCFGERYINVSKNEAAYDLEYNRDELVGTFNALLEYAQGLSSGNDI